MRVSPAQVIAFAIAALAILPMPAQAQRPSRWPSAVVTYRDETKATVTVREAVRQWNAATTRVRLVKARRGQRPRMRIIARKCPATGGFCGYYPPDGRVYIGGGARTRAGDRPDDGLFAALVAHEIGHGLGLVHTDKCGVMYPVNPLSNGNCSPVDRRRPPQATWAHCGPQPTDARALVRLYGGKPRSAKRLGWCPPYPYPKPPAALADLVAPTDELTILESGRPLGTSVDVILRNRSSWAWGSRVAFPDVTGTVQLRVIDAGGKQAPIAACFPATFYNVTSPSGADGASEKVKRGGTGTYPLRVCGDGVSDSGLVRLQLMSFSSGGERPGPIFTLRWRMDRRPVPAFTIAPASGSISGGTNTMTFADTSTDDRGPIASRAWSFSDDGQEATGATVQHTFTQPGTFYVGLVVRDGAGQAQSMTQTVEISE